MRSPRRARIAPVDVSRTGRAFAGVLLEVPPFPAAFLAPVAPLEVPFLATLFFAVALAEADRFGVLLCDLVVAMGLRDGTILPPRVLVLRQATPPATPLPSAIRAFVRRDGCLQTIQYFEAPAVDGVDRPVRSSSHALTPRSPTSDRHGEPGRAGSGRVHRLSGYPQWSPDGDVVSIFCCDDGMAATSSIPTPATSERSLAEPDTRGSLRQLVPQMAWTAPANGGCPG
jgi:hypothetical protein